MIFFISKDIFISLWKDLMQNDNIEMQWTFCTDTIITMKILSTDLWVSRLEKGIVKLTNTSIEMENCITFAMVAFKTVLQHATVQCNQNSISHTHIQRNWLAQVQEESPHRPHHTTILLTTTLWSLTQCVFHFQFLLTCLPVVTELLFRSYRIQFSRIFFSQFLLRARKLKTLRTKNFAVLVDFSTSYLVILFKLFSHL